MRICQVIEPTTGGSIRVALDISYQLAATGDDVTLLYSPLRADAAFYSKIEEEKRVRFVSFPIKNYVSWNDILAVLRLVWFLWRNGPYDVLHSHSSKAGGIARLAGLFFPRMAKIYSPHAFYTMSPYAPRFYGKVERLLSVLTDMVIAVSAFEKQHAVCEIGIRQDKVAVVPNAVQPFDIGYRKLARQMMEQNETDFVLGFVGRLVEQKNVERLIAAFKMALDQKPEIRLVILGDGSCRGLLDEAIRVHQVQNNVRVIGNKDARPYYVGFDALVCSSDYEGFSLVFLESLYAGTPIVTTPVGGAQEAVVEGRTGFVARDFLDKSLADVIVRFASLAPETRAQMRVNAREHGGSFTLSALCQNVRQIYKGSLEKRRV